MEYGGLVDRMDGMCVALGCVYQMYRFIVSVVLRSMARDRLVLALAQEFSLDPNLGTGHYMCRYV